MDIQDPDPPDPTAQNRRQFMQRTGAASVVAALGLSGEATTATAMMDDGAFGTDPFTLGVASGDPLSDSVIIWTRLAPDPLAGGGGMPDESVDVQWTVATDEAMSDVVTSGTATADPAHAHTVHVDVRDLDPNTEYYYQFAAGGKRSTVGRTKTAPEAGESVDEFRFAFASCQQWPDGYFTPFEHMAKDELDLIVHLGDYIYEYGIGNDNARGESLPQDFRAETESLERYRQQYALYKSDPDLRAAHASAPWLVTRDDHEVDNNWAGDVPQDPDKQSMEAFLRRRAIAFKVYYEHMPFRMAQRPSGPDQKLYRNYAFGDLVEFNVLDTRLYRSDQACGDAFVAVDCEARFDEERTILGDAQEEWLVNNLTESEATWDVVANQLPMAQMDYKVGFFTGSAEGEGFRMDQWDGYVADQNTVLRTFEEHVRNPIVITGDIHRHFANDVLSPDSGDPVGAEFVGTSISSGGDGTDMDAFGSRVVNKNDNIHYYSGQRGYVSCTLTPEACHADYQVVEYVSKPDSPVRTDARFTVEDGVPGLQQPPTSLVVDPLAVQYGASGTTDLLARWLPDGFAGATVSVSLTDPEVASFVETSVPDSFGLAETTVTDDGATVSLRMADLENATTAVAGGTDVPLATLTITGEAAGTTDVEIQVDRFDDDSGSAVETETYRSLVVVGPPPTGSNSAPTDLDGDGHYEDVNGNGRLDYDDVTELFDNIKSDAIRLNRDAYDFNENGDLDYDDVVTLYETVEQ
ncbi:alkaline phosphatase D family protein [Salinigranum halophilum]|uniref:alkaline phosphatase D family protein n=1 Tax=Salinigranum halophilum TaxID=2565931 RepID=UPI00191BF89F|nr:alkaline phosphatase D family protein [Salinigranum halophilum]